MSFAKDFLRNRHDGIQFYIKDKEPLEKEALTQATHGKE